MDASLKCALLHPLTPIALKYYAMTFSRAGEKGFILAYRKKLCLQITPMQPKVLSLQHSDHLHNVQGTSFHHIFLLYTKTVLTCIVLQLIHPENVRFHQPSRPGHFKIKNRFSPKGYLILRTVDYFYEGQLEIPQVSKPVKD